MAKSKSLAPVKRKRRRTKKAATKKKSAARVLIVQLEPVAGGRKRARVPVLGVKSLERALRGAIAKRGQKGVVAVLIVRGLLPRLRP